MRKNRRGFSLLEILIAIAILSFSIVPIISIYRYSTQANVKSVFQVQAATLAAERLEMFKFAGTLPPSPSVEPSAEPVLGEYLRLRKLLEEASAPVGATFDDLKPNWKPYERLEEYGKIANHPNFKRYTRIAYFPEESPDPTKYSDSILAPEYVLQTSRIKIYVEVTWAEIPEDQGNALRERKLTMFTVVANKN